MQTRIGVYWRYAMLTLMTASLLAGVLAISALAFRARAILAAIVLLLPVLRWWRFAWSSGWPFTAVWTLVEGIRMRVPGQGVDSAIAVPGAADSLGSGQACDSFSPAGCFVIHQACPAPDSGRALGSMGAVVGCRDRETFRRGRKRLGSRTRPARNLNLTVERNVVEEPGGEKAMCVSHGRFRLLNICAAAFTIQDCQP